MKVFTLGIAKYNEILERKITSRKRLAVETKRNVAKRFKEGFEKRGVDELSERGKAVYAQFGKHEKDAQALVDKEQQEIDQLQSSKKKALNYIKATLTDVSNPIELHAILGLLVELAQDEFSDDVQDEARNLFTRVFLMKVFVSKIKNETEGRLAETMLQVAVFAFHFEDQNAPNPISVSLLTRLAGLSSQAKIATQACQLLIHMLKKRKGLDKAVKESIERTLNLVSTTRKRRKLTRQQSRRIAKACDKGIKLAQKKEEGLSNEPQEKKTTQDKREKFKRSRAQSMSALPGKSQRVLKRNYS